VSVPCASATPAKHQKRKEEIRVATSSSMVIFGRDELDLIVEFAGCSLDESPGSNWVQRAGGLPDYICRIARAIKKTGKTTSQAISIAVSRVKVWAAGKGVDHDTQAKASAALAEWEKLRATSHAKTAAKAATASLSRTQPAEILMLTSASYNVDSVRQAWQKSGLDGNGSRPLDPDNDGDDDGPPMRSWNRPWIKEMWSDFLIVECDDGDLFKVPFEVDDNGVVDFDDPTPVKTQYVAIGGDAMVGSDIDDGDLQRMVNMTSSCYANASDRILLSVGEYRSAVEKFLILANSQSKGPYGDVAYADPKNKKYPVDTAAHVRAAWSYISQAANAKNYSSADLAAIKGRIRTAAKKFNIEISGD
jgi:hypothetical protein